MKRWPLSTLWSHTYQLNGVITLALWPIAFTEEINRVGVLGVHYANQMLLYQTQLITFAVEPENGASLERPEAMHYNLRLLLVFCCFWNTSETGSFSLMMVTKKRLTHLLFPVTVFTLCSFQATRFLPIPTFSFRVRLSRDLSTLPLYLTRAKWFPRILGNRVNLKNPKELLRILEKACKVIKFPEIRGNSQNFF